MRLIEFIKNLFKFSRTINFDLEEVEEIKKSINKIAHKKNPTKETPQKKEKKSPSLACAQSKRKNVKFEKMKKKVG
jgi:hypothetical protein